MNIAVTVETQEGTGHGKIFYVRFSYEGASMRIPCGTKVHAEELAKKFAIFFGADE